MFTLKRIGIALLSPLFLMAQGLTWNAGIISQLGRGEQVGAPYDYLENFLNSSFEYGHWYLDLSFEYSDPPEYGFAVQNLDRLYLSYIGDRVTLEAGDISAVFGRGLALNLTEDQAIDFDNEIQGLRLTTALFETHELDVLMGANREYHFYSPSSDSREPDGELSYALAGMELSLNGGSGLWSASPYAIFSKMNSDYVWREIDAQISGIATDTVDQTLHSLQLGWGQAVYAETWDLYLEYNRTLKAVDFPWLTQTILPSENGLKLINEEARYTRQAQALNFQVNWFPEWFSAMFEYKRYLNGRESLSDKRDPYKASSKPLPWQMGPTCIREHDINLLGNVTHPIDYGDELGWNLEIRRGLAPKWTLTLNAAQASQAADSKRFWSEQDLSLNPWQEYFAEVEYSGTSIYQRMLIAYTRGVISGHSAAEIMDHLTLVPAYLSWHPSGDLNLSTVLEMQLTHVSSQTYAGDALEGYDFRSTHTILSADYRHNYSLSVIWDTSSDPNLLEESQSLEHWVSTEISVKPLDKLWVRASYGREKGGVRCTGGVCRVLNPFEGFRMALEWRI